MALVHQSRQGQTGAFAFLSDALRDRPPEFGHPMDHGTGDVDFDLLGGERAGAQTGSDQGLVAKQRRFPQGSLALADRLLPTPSSLLLHLHPLAVSVPQAGRSVRGGTRYSGRPRWNDHDRRRLWLPFGHRAVDGFGVVATPNRYSDNGIPVGRGYYPLCELVGADHGSTERSDYRLENYTGISVNVAFRMADHTPATQNE